MQNITNEHVLPQLLIALGDAITHEVEVLAPGRVAVLRSLPIAVFLTGLPDSADMSGARKGATFARRFKTTTLGPIGDEDLAASLQPFVTEGWEVNDEQGGTARVGMEESARKAILEAMSELDPADRTLSRIADHMGYAKASAAGPASQRLETIRGIIQRGKPVTFRNRAIEAYLTSTWPDIG